MSIIKSFSVGNGDMFYIKHNSDNFTIIDCQLFEDQRQQIVEELKRNSREKSIVRFISTHPDEDHIQGLEYLDKEMPIQNFYVVQNDAKKSDETDSFKHYCKLRDSDKAYYVEKGCSRRWMNCSCSERGGAGINILWPNITNRHFKDALEEANSATNFNNISLVANYLIRSGGSFMWMGDLETEFMENIYEDIELSETTIVFAPHHGRKSGRIPKSWLEKIKPKIIVIGEAQSQHLEYYEDYNTITQNRAGDITFTAEAGKIHCYVSEKNYGIRPWLSDEGKTDREYYIGTLNV